MFLGRTFEGDHINVKKIEKLLFNIDYFIIMLLLFFAPVLAYGSHKLFFLSYHSYYIFCTLGFEIPNVGVEFPPPSLDPKVDNCHILV